MSVFRDPCFITLVLVSFSWANYCRTHDILLLLLHIRLHASWRCIILFIFLWSTINESMAEHR